MPVPVISRPRLRGAVAPRGATRNRRPGLLPDAKRWWRKTSASMMSGGADERARPEPAVVGGIADCATWRGRCSAGDDQEDEAGEPQGEADRNSDDQRERIRQTRRMDMLCPLIALDRPAWRREAQKPARRLESSAKLTGTNQLGKPRRGTADWKWAKLRLNAIIP